MRRAAIALLLAGCSSGPQVPVTTPVVSIAVTVQAIDGGTRSYAKPITTGIETAGGEDSR